MIDIEKQRAECARMQAMCDEKAPPEWKAKLLGEAIWNCAFADRARTDWPALIAAHREACDEIERLRRDVLRENSIGETHRQECERLKAAGKVLAVSLRENWGGEISRKEDEACRVFEEGE